MKTLELLILFIMAFLPPIIYAIWIRNTEKFNREKWKPIFFCFLWGAAIAVIASIILEIVLGYAVALTTHDYTTYMFIVIVIVAPFVEEFTKPLALRFNIVKKELDELEDGLIYGAVAGLGFAATENLFYGYNALLTAGFTYFIILITIRSFTGCMIHASATAWTGYGYGKVVMKHTTILRVLPYFIIAILVHAFYNFLPTFGILIGSSAIVLLAFLFVPITILIVRRKIRTLDNLSK